MNYIIDSIMVFSPVIGYIDQYKNIKQSKNSKSFSTLVSLILFLSNTLRIFFWYGKRFEIVMLYQSIVMIICQFFMIHICTSFPSDDFRGNSLFDLKNFWKWKSFFIYLQFFGILFVSLSLLSSVFIEYSFYVELLGSFSLLIESLLGLPQAIKNFKMKSTKGLSIVLIGTWFVGDLFKTIYFSFNGLPIQFIICGVTQIIMDTLILYQMFIYH
eukprot:gene8989-1088_t